MNTRSQGKPAMRPPNQDSSHRDDPTGDALSQLRGLAAPPGMSRTDTGYTTAIAVTIPRDIKAVEKAILMEAAETGEDFVYSWEVKDKNSKTGYSLVEGLSIDGAIIMMRNWGNCHIPTRKTDETPTHFEIEAVFIDLEKGFSFPRLFRQRKNVSFGGMDKDRAEDISFQIGQSKCQRNAIDKAMPAWLVKKAIEAAKAKAEEKYQDVPASVKAVRAYAVRIGVTDEELQRKVGQAFADWLPRDIVYIRSVYKAISDRQSTVTLEFRQRDETQEAEQDAPPPEVIDVPNPDNPLDLPPIVTDDRTGYRQSDAEAAKAREAEIAKAQASIEAEKAKPPAEPEMSAADMAREMAARGGATLPQDGPAGGAPPADPSPSEKTPDGAKAKRGAK